METRNKKKVRSGLPVSSLERSRNGRWFVFLGSGTAKIVF